LIFFNNFIVKSKKIIVKREFDKKQFNQNIKIIWVLSLCNFLTVLQSTVGIFKLFLNYSLLSNILINFDETSTLMLTINVDETIFILKHQNKNKIDGFINLCKGVEFFSMKRDLPIIFVPTFPVSLFSKV